MDIDKLSKADVQKLLAEIKYFSENINISIPLVGKYKLDKEVIGKNSEIEYRFHVYRGKLKPRKYSLHLRFSDNNIHLVRLCVNGTKHKNYDGTEADKNHIHIYKYIVSQDAVFDYAYNLDDFPFDENDELVDAVDKFNKYINLKK